MDNGEAIVGRDFDSHDRMDQFAIALQCARHLLYETGWNLGLFSLCR